MCAQPEDVLPYIDRNEPFCFKRVGKSGRPVMVPLPPQGVEAWRLLIRKNAWGKFSRSNVNRDWKAGMQRAGEKAFRKALAEGANAEELAAIQLAFTPRKMYALRHSYATRLLQKGSDDLSLVQEALGHRDIRTTRTYTTVIVNPRLVEAVRRAFQSSDKKVGSASHRKRCPFERLHNP
jgi:site-specific recombinase XerD